MKTKFIIFLFALLLNLPLVLGQGTAFTYQGRLTDNGNAANGTYDLQFAMHGVPSGGGTIAGPLTLSSVGVSNGIFTVTLDFGAGVFDGSPRWVQIGVRTNGSVDAFVALLPRQAITSTPYAIQSAGLTGLLPDTQLSANVARLNSSNAFSGPVNFNPATGSPFTVSNNKKVANLNADLLDSLDSTSFWKTAGNLGTTPTTNFLGTLDNQPLELRANNQTVMSLNPGGNVGIGTTSPQDKLDVAGDIHSVNIKADGNVAIGAGQISGVRLHVGADNLASLVTDGNVGIGTTSPGNKLDVVSSGGSTLIGIANLADSGDIGMDNGMLRIRTLNAESVVFYPGDAGEKMRIQENGNVGIGTATPTERLSISGSGPSATIMTLRDSGGSTRLRFDYNGSVTAMGTDGNSRLDLGATAFSANASIPNALSLTTGGNVGIGTTTPSERLSVNGKTYIEGVVTGPETGGGNATLTVRGTVDASNGRLVHLYAPWGTTFNTDRLFMVGHDVTGSAKFLIRGDGAYLQSSSRELKTSIKPIAKPLDILTSLHGVYFKWKGATDSQQNAGFIAEDIAEVFPEASASDKKAVNYPAVIPLLVEGVKELDAKLAKLDQRAQHVATIDADGVALAAIQGLNLMVKERDSEIDGLKQRLAELEKTVAALAGAAK